MKYKHNLPKSNILEVASFAINTTSKLTWTILILFTLGGSILGLWGISTINDLQDRLNDEFKKLEEKGDLVENMYDSLNVKYRYIVGYEDELKRSLKKIKENFSTNQIYLTNKTNSFDSKLNLYDQKLSEIDTINVNQKLLAEVVNTTIYLLELQRKMPKPAIFWGPEMDKEVEKYDHEMDLQKEKLLKLINRNKP